jgi:hypothetical protein
MEKKDRKSILAGVKEEISKGPKTIYELSKNLGSNWDTIKKNVDLLADLGIASTDDGKVVLSDRIMPSMPYKTMAGIPVSPEKRKEILKVAKMFQEIWKTNSDKPIPHTVMQKALAEISDNYSSLDFPRGWYLYGKVVLVHVLLDELEKTDLDKKSKDRLSLLPKFADKLKEITARYSSKNTDQVLNYFYEKYNKEDYMIKKQIEKLLFTVPATKEALSNLLYELTFKIPYDSKDELCTEVYAVIRDGITLMIKKIDICDINDLTFRAKLSENFTLLWKLIATYNLYMTLEGDTGYDPSIIRAFFVDRVDEVKEEFIDLYTESGFASL